MSRNSDGDGSPNEFGFHVSPCVENARGVGVSASWLLMSAVSCRQKVAKRHDIRHDGDMSAKCRHHVGYVELVGRYGGKTKASVKLVCERVGETCPCRQKSATFSCRADMSPTFRRHYTTKVGGVERQKHSGSFSATSIFINSTQKFTH